MSRLGLGLGLEVIKPIIAGIGGAGGDLKTSLAAWYPFDEGSGDRSDAHTNGYDLTDNNTVLNATAKVGANAALFVDSASEFLNRVNAAEAWRMNTGDLTLGFWVKFTAFDTGATQVLVACGVTGSTVIGYLVAVQADGTRLRIYLSNGTTWITHTGLLDSAFSAGVWYFIIVEYDRDNKLQAYKNNVKESLSTSIASFDTDDITSVAGLTFGKNTTSNDQYLNAALDEGFIYNRLLTSDEKTFLWNDSNGRAYSEIG